MTNVWQAVKYCFTSKEVEHKAEKRTSQLSRSVVSDSLRPHEPQQPGLPVHHHLPESTQPMSIESVMPPHHLILCCPLLLPPSIFPSIRVFSNESALRIRGPKYWSFSFIISLSNEYSGLISFRMDWSNLLAVQRTLKRLDCRQYCYSWA